MCRIPPDKVNEGELKGKEIDKLCKVSMQVCYSCQQEEAGIVGGQSG